MKAGKAGKEGAWGKEGRKVQGRRKVRQIAQRGSPFEYLKAETVRGSNQHVCAQQRQRR
jgi:hypothetical protein